MTALCLAVLAACAGRAGNGVIIDRQGVNIAAYEEDLAECTAYAHEVRTGERVATGAAGGAAVGGAVGAVNRGSEGAARGAATGAVIGGAGGARDARREQDQVVKACLRGRGYRVLN